MERKISNIKERVLQIAENKGVTKEKFFEKIGVTYAGFKGKQKTQALSSDTIERIISIYTDINTDWLLTGKGEMFKQEIDALAEEKKIKLQELKENIEKAAHESLMRIRELKSIIKDKEDIIKLLKEENARLKAVDKSHTYTKHTAKL